jgi:hypothetical protein
MNALLRQPGGFEGFGLGLVAAAMNDLALAEREHLPRAALDRGARLLAATSLMEADNYGVAGVDGLLGLEAEILKRLGPLAKELPYLGRSVVRGHSLWKRTDVIPFDVLIEDCEQGLDVRRGGFRQRLPEHLHVVRRHRPAVSRGGGPPPQMAQPRSSAARSGSTAPLFSAAVKSKAHCRSVTWLGAAAENPAPMAIPPQSPGVGKRP